MDRRQLEHAFIESTRTRHVRCVDCRFQDAIELWHDSSDNRAAIFVAGRSDKNWRPHDPLGSPRPVLLDFLRDAVLSERCHPRRKVTAEWAKEGNPLCFG